MDGAPATPHGAQPARKRSLADAEAGEDHAQQIVGSEFAGDLGQRALRQAQFLGQQVEHRRRAFQVRAGSLQMAGGAGQRLQVALARDEQAIARARHVEALRAVDAHLMEAAAQLESTDPALDLLAEELRLAQNALNAITGEFTSDDLLGVIFSSFCIGK